ncbi:uncharacterized protein PGTG_06574 [Puccinia graminis f. sp. tritici CRL 75-36-700-3]|uniref:Uncharacterized protein n=1 Tax=Puccinia graminis f. sp. tritici (strain CRL 75-36-700-3 / race SCCL) TaxID=418459 RepID=E3K8N7_PUCGT|nr:uncharacterized protein PGTG_06574 [Puccinia graminis f. sp. tritici CRL 75-36-700-3]EFP80618.2 hypothetical protein PGTG_06574 [Puccinia graminis f. sp. tritici CRL 75-36-700-3]
MAPTALQLSSEERLAYPYLFSKADTDQIGVLVGEKAVAFFAHSNLPPTILGEIWQLADQDNAGFLTRQQFDIALRLIGKAQRGLPVNEQAISSPGPLCVLKGFSVPGLPSPSTPPAPRPPNSTPLGISEPVQDPLYTIGNEDKLKYSSMFIKAGPRDGLLDGDKARDIFIRSKLSFEKLGQIWTLADTQSRGALSVSDFCIAMHLIQLSMSGRLSTFPTSLPSALLDSATAPVAGAVLPISRQVTGQQQSIPGSLPPSSPLRKSSTGSAIRPQYTGRSASGVPSSLPTGINSIIGSPTGLAWDISSAELAQSNIYFDSLDTNRLGYITGDRAVPFMMESKLPGEILARIWDLADIRGEGKLNREEFAVAMRLIQDTLAGGVESLTAKLSPGMVPPSLREPAGLPAIPETSTTQQDLLSLLDDPPNVTQPSQNDANKPKHSAPPNQQPSLPVQLTGTHSMTPAARVASPLSSSQGYIGAQTTGQFGQSSSSRGLGEDDGAKLGNLVNQLSSTENALSTLHDERSRLERHTRSTVEQIKTLELKLSTARQMHQNELPLVEELRRKQVEQRSTMSKLTSDVITAESELSSLKLEKEQIEGSILRDKEEIRDMKKRMAQLEEETQRLKSSLETLKKDSRLQKGLIAIGKKQVLTVEGQKADISKEMDDLTQQIHSIALPPEGSRAPSPGVPPQSVPSQKSTNPFERMMPAASLTPQASAIHSPEASGSRDLNQSPHSSATRLGVSTDPFLGGSDGPAQFLTALSPNTLSFGDAFGLDESKTEDNRSPADHGGFHDARETTSPDPPPSAKFSPPIAQRSEETKKTEDPKKDESDESSDEEEIEDPVARHLAPSSRPGKAASFASDKFPALEDVEASVQSKATASSPVTSQDTGLQGGKGESSMTQAGTSLGTGAGGATPGSTIKASPIKSSATSNKSVEQNKPSINSGDELEVSDFVADFGLIGSSSSAAGATLEDFDSAFENLPSPESKRNPTRNGEHKPGNPHLTGTTTTNSIGFDDGFDDAFVVMDRESSKKDQSSPLGFDESFSDFDKILAGGNSSQNTSSGDSSKVQKKEQDDPFGSPPPSSPTEPPPLPTRPTNSSSLTSTTSTSAAGPAQQSQQDMSAKNEPAKPTDSDAVKQICGMGFDRKVVIQALERDEWDVDRALNHLLGT